MNIDNVTSDLTDEQNEAFRNGDVEVKIISVSFDDMDHRIQKALMDGWKLVKINANADTQRAFASLIRSTSNKVEE